MNWKCCWGYRQHWLITFTWCSLYSSTLWATRTRYSLFLPVGECTVLCIFLCSLFTPPPPICGAEFTFASPLCPISHRYRWTPHPFPRLSSVLYWGGLCNIAVLVTSFAVISVSEKWSVTGCTGVRRIGAVLSCPSQSCLYTRSTHQTGQGSLHYFSFHTLS
jgi:hypothetical protein